MTVDELRAMLGRYGQDHLLMFWDELDADQRRRLSGQIEHVDWETVGRLAVGSAPERDWGSLADRASGPQAIRLDQSPRGWSRGRAVDTGEAALRAGRVGVLLVAGGQGTRLSFPFPKGMYPIGPLSRRSLFAMHFDRIQAVAARYGFMPHVFVMTSPATDAATRTYFAEHDWLGLGEQQLHLFCQGTMPAVDRAGRVLLESKDALALSPDGHGGVLAALDRQGQFRRIEASGIDQLYYFQVDNPLADVLAPEFIGHHLLGRSEVTTQVVAKRDPGEKVGNVVEVDGRIMVIEYIDLPHAAAQRRHPDGSLVLWAGNIAIHMFDVAFLRRMAGDAHALPFHLSQKSVPYMDVRTGVEVQPDAPNATKFERFVFDLLPDAARPLVVEVDERWAFAPLKNAPGAAKDTPEYVEQLLIERDRQMLRSAGVDVRDSVRVEIHPSYALRPADLARKIAEIGPITEDRYLI